MATETKRPRGRPPIGRGEMVAAQFRPEALEIVDAYRRVHSDPPNRPEAVRRLVRDELMFWPLTTTEMLMVTDFLIIHQ